MSQYIGDLNREKNLHLKSTEVLLQTVWENSHKIITTFGLMTKKIFIRDCCGSNSLIDNFKSMGLVILSHHILPKDTVTKRDLTKLSKSTDKKGSDLPADNFHCSFSNKHMKNTQKCTHVLKRADLNLIFWSSHKILLHIESIQLNSKHLASQRCYKTCNYQLSISFLRQAKQIQIQ